MKKRALSWLLAVVMVVSLAPQIIPKAAAETDAFGITLSEDNSFNAGDLKNNPYGTAGWFSLITHSELVETRTKRDRARNQYVYRYTGLDSRKEEASFSQPKDYTLIATAAFDADGDGRKELVANLAYYKAGQELQLYTTDSNGQKGNTKKLESADFLQKVWAYHATSHMAIAAGDFDGDGKETVVVYQPNSLKLVEYEWNSSGWSDGTQVTHIGGTLGDKGEDRLDWVMANDNDGGGDELRATPSVQLAVDDTDKDGKDELVVASSWNDLEQDNYKYGNDKHNANWQCSWVSVFDQDSGWKKTFNQVLQKEQKETESGRLRFAGVTVGNVEQTTGDVDAPEIICVGYPDKKGGDNCDINEGEFGIYTFRYGKDKDGNGKYERILNDQRVPANEFSKGGCYGSDKIQDPVAVVAFASRGNTYADDLFIEGDVYRYTGGKFNFKYRDNYFNDDDDGINRFIISNGGVSQAIAANFTGDINGKEEVVFSTVQKYKHGTGHFWRTRMYCNTGTQSGSTWVDDDDRWSQKDYGWSLYHDGESQTALTAADIGENDGTQAKIKSKTRSYTDPQVMAILEAPPYFAEIAEGDIGNGTTAYGKAKTTGGSKTDSTSVSLGAMVGFEYEDPITSTGGGFEATISNEWTWETTESVEREITTTYSNDSGDNAVVVFRTPVVTYEYEVRGYAAGATKNNRMAIGIQGQPAHNMISVDDYNAAADQFGLDRITNDMIGSAGNPSSYHQGLPSSKKSYQSWTSDRQYSYAGSGTIEQSVTDTTSTEESSSYSFNAEVSAFVSICGVKGGLSAGGGFGSGTTTMNSKSTSKTGAVSARPNVTNADNYNFNWQFATWTQHLNGDEVPVLGYLVNSITAPPSPAENLALSEHSKNSMKLTWEAGDRPANEYRVYRYNPNNAYSVYTQVGTVSGGSAVDSTYTYLLSELTPNTTYQYVVTGYSLQNGESVYSEVATGTTLADSGQSLVLNELKDQSALIGEEAVFQVDFASFGDYSSVGYRWQEKLPGSNWKDAENGTASTLRVTATGERSGAQYRCIVYGKSQAGDAVPYYTNAAKLTIGQNIHPSLTIDDHGGGSGTQAEPYTGTANYPILTKNTTKETVKDVQPSVKVPVDGEQKEALVYKVGDQLVATVVDKNNKTYYFAVTKTGEAPKAVYTAGAELDYNVATNFQKSTEAYTWPGDTVQDGVLQPLSVPINKKTYYRYIGVKGTFENYTLPQYNANGDLTNADQITTEPVEAKLKTVTELGSQYISADGRTFYAYTEGMSSLPAEETLPDGITAMELYQSETSGVTLVGHLDQDLYYTPASGSGETATKASWDVVSEYRLYEIEKKTSGEGETTTTYIPTEITSSTTETLSGTGFTTVTGPTLTLTPETTSVDRKVTTYTESTNEGKQLTLSVTATKGTTDGAKAANADYTIRLVNQSTGAVTTLTGKTDADGKDTQKWTADAPGLYAIQVITGDNVTPTQYYLASGPGDLYSLTAEDGNNTVVTTATYGDTVSLNTTRSTTTGSTEYKGTGTDSLQYSYSINGGKGNPIDSATGKPKDEVVISTPSAFRLPDVGTFTLYVKENNKTLASTVLTVEKRAITLEPIWKTESTGEAPAQLIDIKPKADNLASGDSLDNIVQVVCSLYKNGTLDKTQSGAFTVSLDYVKDGEDKYTAAVQSFLSHYQVTLKTAQILRKLDTFPIYYEAGENGELEGRWGDSGQAFTSSDLIEKGQPLRFQATPKDGYVVDSWTVNGTKIDTNSTVYKLSDDKTILTASSFSDGMLDSNQQMKVVVSFKSDQHTISYSVNDSNGLNGTLTANTSDNNPVANGGNVAEGTSVTFTAKPNTGYSIEKWVVDNVEYTWPDSKALYRSKTLILENISKSHKVEVYFTDKAAIQISTSLIHEDGNATSAAEITVADVTDASKTLDLNNIESGSSLLFTAKPESTNIGVKKWQTSTDNGQTWTTVTGSGGQKTCTLYNLTKSTQVRAVLTTAQSYELTFKVQKDGQEVPDSIATLTAKINNLALTSGHSQPAYSQVDFALELSEDYYVVGWTGASNAEGNKTTSARLNSLTKTTTVIVNIQEKPKVTVTTPENGRVEVTGTRTGTGAVTLNGSSGENGHVDLNSKVTISATPEAGYFVKDIVVTVGGNTQTKNYDTAENYKACAVTLKDIEITKDTSIQVNFAQKPVVTFTGDDHIAVTAKQGDNELTSGDWVDKFSGDIVFTATPKKGWETAGWNGLTYSPVDSTANDNTTYTQSGPITSNVNINVAAKAIDQSTLNLSVLELSSDTYGGTVSAKITRKSLEGYTDTTSISKATSGTARFYHGSNIVITATPAEGYRVQDWTIGNKTTTEDATTKTLTGLSADETVKVRFVRNVTGLTFGPIDPNHEGGYISAATDNSGSIMNHATSGVNITAGIPINFTAEIKPGYEIEGWYVNTERDSQAGNQSTYTYRNTEGKSSIYVGPRFQQKEYKITTGKHVTVGQATETVARGGEELTFTAEPPAGQKVTGWKINGQTVTGDGNQLKWKVQNGYTVTPHVTEYKVEAIYGAGDYTVTYGEHIQGSVASNSPVHGGDVLTFTATPMAHQSIVWNITGGTYTINGNTATVTVTGNVTVSVTYGTNQYTITKIDTTGGTVIMDSSSGTVAANTQVKFTATPDAAYEFVRWEISGSTAEDLMQSELTLTVTGNTTVKPVFVKKMITVGATVVGKAGTMTMTVDGQKVTNGTVPYGSNVTFTVVPSDRDCVVNYWKVGTDEVKKMDNTSDAPFTYTINDVTTETQVEVQLIERPTYTITATPQGHGSVSANMTSVKRGGNVIVTAKPEQNYYLKHWLVNDVKQNTNGSDTLTLTEIRQATKVVAVFDVARAYDVTLNITGAEGSTVTVTANGSEIKPGAASPASVVGGSKLVFTASPAMRSNGDNTQMVARWTVKVNGTERPELSTIANVLTIPSLEGKTEVSVEFTDYQGFNIPTASADQKYEIKNVTRIPDDTQPETQIRAGGTVEFVVKPATKGAIVTDVELPNCGTVTQTKQQDGSMKIKVEKVTANVTITDVTVENGIPLTITQPSNGKIIVKNGDTELESGAKVQKETILTITATPNSNYTLDQLTVTGATKQNDGTYKVNAKATALTVAATFKASSSGGGGGGGGGGAVSTYTLTFDTNGGSAIDKITKDSGTTIDLAAYKPTRAGYTFAGWFSDKALTKAVTSVKLTANTTVYAKWTQSGTAQNPFVDVKEGAYYYDAVLWAVEQKITSGTSATTFSPDASCTRAQMVTFLWRAAGSPKVENGKNPFTDVQADAYYYDAVLWAVEKGVTSGTSATTFSPDATVTRGQTVTFLYRNAGSPEVSGTMPFTDVEADAYYAKAVQWAVQQKITTGTSETTFSPMSDCTRGQIVTFLYRAK